MINNNTYARMTFMNSDNQTPNPKPAAQDPMLKTTPGPQPVQLKPQDIPTDTAKPVNKPAGKKQITTNRNQPKKGHLAGTITLIIIIMLLLAVLAVYAYKRS